jgi:enoyl-CoA hydratase/carnithine racemase
MPTYQSNYSPETAPQNLEHIIYEKKGHVAYVTINRPETRNALHSHAYAELRACWRDIAIDPNIYCGIVTGAPEGKAFSSGRDVKFLANHQAQGKRTPHEDPSNPAYHWGGGGQPSDANLEKPLIAAINGLAIGVGLSLALQCQLRVMSEEAWIGDTHTKIGRVGSPHNLYEALPRTAAAYLTLCNGRLTAQECLQQGIVNRVVPADQLMSTADGVRRFAARVASCRSAISFERRVPSRARRLRQATGHGNRRERRWSRRRTCVQGEAQAGLEDALDHA